VSLSDTPNGLKATLDDLTTGQSGSMTASKATGLAQVNSTRRAISPGTSQAAFDAELPGIEPTCNTLTGAGCTLIPQTDEGDPAT
jgi:hypothetical protein